MTIGDSLLTIFIILVIGFSIYIISKKKKWKIVLRVMGIIISLIILAGAGFHGYWWLKNIPGEASSLGKISLNMTPVEVKLILGSPNRINFYSSGVTHGEVYTYNTYLSSADYIIRFNDKKKVSVICTESYKNKIFGIGVYDKEKKVIKKLGKPTNTSINERGTQKYISYKDNKVSFRIEKETVKSVCVASSGKVVFTKGIDDF